MRHEVRDRRAKLAVSRRRHPDSHGFFHSAADCDSRALSQGVIEEVFDAVEILRVDDLEDAFLFDLTSA
jgi:hypothetical protein